MGFWELQDWVIREDRRVVGYTYARWHESERVRELAIRYLVEKRKIDPTGLTRKMLEEAGLMQMVRAYFDNSVYVAVATAFHGRGIALSDMPDAEDRARLTNQNSK